MKKNILNILFVFVLISLLTLAYSCSNNDNPVISAWENNSINGTITFVDTLGYISDTTGGYYNIDAFNTWYPVSSPTSFSLLNITKSGNKYIAAYKLSNVPEGSYAIAVAWNKKPYVPGNSTYLLATYGCDTTYNPSCWSPANIRKVTIASDNKGVGNINILSYIDTAQKIIKF